MVGVLFVAQSRAISGNSTSLTVPFPTRPISISGTLPGLSSGMVTVKVYNQTGANSWSLVGTSLLPSTTRVLVPGVSSITPNPIDLAAPPASFIITGGGFTNFGFGLSVANFNGGSFFLAQSRAISGNSTSLTVPFPTNAISVSGTLPGLSAGMVTVKVYNQTGANSWSLIGSTSPHHQRHASWSRGKLHHAQPYRSGGTASKLHYYGRRVHQLRLRSVRSQLYPGAVYLSLRPVLFQVIVRVSRCRFPPRRHKHQRNVARAQMPEW